METYKDKLDAYIRSLRSYNPHFKYPYTIDAESDDKDFIPISKSDIKQALNNIYGSRCWFYKSGRKQALDSIDALRYCFHDTLTTNDIVRKIKGDDIVGILRKNNKVEVARGMVFKPLDGRVILNNIGLAVSDVELVQYKYFNFDSNRWCKEITFLNGETLETRDILSFKFIEDVERNYYIEDSIRKGVDKNLFNSSISCIEITDICMKFEINDTVRLEGLEYSDYDEAFIIDLDSCVGGSVEILASSDIVVTHQQEMIVED